MEAGASSLEWLAPAMLEGGGTGTAGARRGSGVGWGMEYIQESKEAHIQESKGRNREGTGRSEQ
jgi:hypothetical protein